MSHSISFIFGGAEAAGSRAVTARGVTKPPCKVGGKGATQQSRGGQIPNKLCRCSRGLKKGVLGRGWRRLECCTHRGHGRLSLLILITHGAVSKPLLDWPLLCGAAACAGGKLRSVSRWAAKSHTCDGQAAGWRGGSVPEEGHLDVKAGWASKADAFEEASGLGRAMQGEFSRNRSGCFQCTGGHAQGEAEVSASSKVFGDLA